MSIKVAAQALLYRQPRAQHGLTASIHRQEKDGKSRFVTDITVPLVDYGSDYKLEELGDLKPGRYVIQTALPNGRVLTRSFDIEPGKATEVVLHVPHEGPHEWSSLHALTGQFRAEYAETRQFSRSVSGTALLYADSKAHPEQGYSLAWLDPDAGPAGPVSSPEQLTERLAAVIADGLGVESAVRLLGHLQEVGEPSLADGEFAIFRFEHDGVLDGENRSDHQFYIGPGEGINRRYLVQRSPEGAQLISLPTPWMTPDGQADVELLVKMHRIPEALDYSMTISDPMINSALGYINNGAVHLAHRLIGLELAQRMLFEKISYPFSATIGGYILVLGRDTEHYRAQSQNWKSWVRNLDDWFEWLPDGAILNASMQLMERQAERNEAEAYKALMRAYSRGLPFFTFGLKYLIDGMRYFADRDEYDVEHCLTVLETIAERADPGVPFLSVQFSNAW